MSVIRNLLVLGMAAAFSAAAAETPPARQQLDDARKRLAELQVVCKDKHPAVQEQLKKIADLEARLKLEGRQDAELDLARQRLAELRKTCKDNHPVVQQQLRVIAELEKSQK